MKPAQFGELVKLISTDVISGKIAKKVLPKMLETGDGAEEIVEREGLKQVTDTGAIEQFVDEVIAANPGQVQEYRDGKESLFGFFMGQVMKASRGKANPGMVQQMLRDKLKG